MCTVTFIARQKGYCLGMNRDEKLTRPTGLPPNKRNVNGRAVLCPSEPGGGTWIALDDGGTTFALINWYSITARVLGKAVSRGEVVNSVSTASTPHFADAAPMSYTEVAVSSRDATMRYHAGAPCKALKHCIRHILLQRQGR